VVGSLQKKDLKKLGRKQEKKLFEMLSKREEEPQQKF
jgi:hypothetical protein